MGDSNTLEDIMFDRGWSRATLDEELRKRRVVLAYLIDRGLNSYAQVAATFQAFINDPETVLALMANDELERSLEDLREMESVLINVDRDKEELVPRPTPDEDGEAEVEAILESAQDLFETYRGEVPDSVADALLEMNTARDVEATPAADREALAEAAREADATDPDERSTGETGPAPTDPMGSGAVNPDTAAGSTDAGPASGSPETPGNGSETAPAAAGDGSGAPSAIDFDEPFEEGVDVLSSPGEPSGSDATPDVSEGFGAADDPTGEPPSDGDPDDAAVGTGDRTGTVDGGAAATDGEAEADDGGSDESDDGEADEPAADGDEAADDIDDWGFGAVEPAEDG
jgi:flagellar protein FlaI